MQVRPGAHASPAPQFSPMPGFVDADGAGGSGAGLGVGGTGLVTGRDCGGAGFGSDAGSGVGSGVVAGGTCDGCDAVGGAGSVGDATGGGAPFCGPAATVSPEPEPGDTDGDEV
jgi:hypothetical protein